MAKLLALVAVTALMDINHDGELYGPGRPNGVDFTVTPAQAKRLFARGAIGPFDLVEESDADADADSDADADADRESDSDTPGEAVAAPGADLPPSAAPTKRPAAKKVARKTAPRKKG